jgi:hypothetical protein
MIDRLNSGDLLLLEFEEQQRFDFPLRRMPRVEHEVRVAALDRNEFPVNRPEDDSTAAYRERVRQQAIARLAQIADDVAAGRAEIALYGPSSVYNSRIRVYHQAPRG